MMDLAAPTWLDRAIGVLSPRLMYERLAYRGAITTRLDTSTSKARGFSRQDQLERRNLASMRDRARRVDQDNHIGHAILNRLVDNCIGEGMTLQVRTTDDAWNKLAETAWNDWSTRCDVHRMMTLVDIQRLTYRALERDGDVAILKTISGGQPALQVIEGENISNPDGRSVDPLRMLDGIEVDAQGRPLRFWVLSYPEGGKREWVSVNYRDMVWYPRIRRPSQMRGESCFAPVFPLLDQIDGYLDAVVVAARMGAVFGLLIKSETASKQFGALSTTTNSAGNSQKAVTLENGSIRYIGPNDDVVQVTPQQPMAQTPEFTRTLIRLVGNAVDLPLELALCDFSQVNLSSARAGIQQFYRATMAKQRRFRDTVLTPIYRWWVSNQILAGNLPDPPADYLAHQFVPQGWRWLDPVVEAQAALLEIDIGVNSPQNVASMLGREYADLQEQIAAADTLRQGLGLPRLHSNLTRHPQLGVGAQGDPQGRESVDPPGGSTPPQDDAEGNDQ